MSESQPNMERPMQTSPALQIGEERQGEQARPEYVDFDVADFPGGLAGCLEAILMSAEEPQQVEDLARILAQSQEEVAAELAQLKATYEEENRGFELVASVRGWRFASRPEYQGVVSAFITDKQTNHLSQASLEALAIIAYKQPITRGQVSAIRGVNSDGVIRSLTMRGLATEMGEQADTHARLLATTDLFLEKIGLDSLEALPALAPFLPAHDAAMEDAEQSDSASSQNPATAFNQFMVDL